MKVKNLIKALQKCDQDLEVVLSCDAEGNAFHKLAEISECMVEIGYRNAKEQAALVLWPDD